MTPGVEFVSAQIIPFPGRSGRREANPVKAIEKLPKQAAAALDTCWYHDEAVRESGPPPTRD